MADPEPLRQILHSRAPLSTWLGIVLLFAVFGVIVLAIIGPSPRGNDYEEMRAKKRMENLKTLREDAEKALNSYAWVDKNKGVVRIPISRAMQLTVAELAKKKPAAAGPIATPPTQAPPSAGPASPAPAGSVKPGGSQPAGSPSAQAASSPAPPAPAARSSATQNAPSAAPQLPAPGSPAPATSP